MTSMKKIQTYLSVEFEHSKHGIGLYQKNYVNVILDKFGVSNCNSCTTPMDKGLKLQNEIEDKLVNETEY